MTFKVVANEERQYSLWPADRKNAPGWKDCGFQGTRDECLQHIEMVWTDLRPQSVRTSQADAAVDGSDFAV